MNEKASVERVWKAAWGQVMSGRDISCEIWGRLANKAKRVVIDNLSMHHRIVVEVEEAGFL